MLLLLHLKGMSFKSKLLVRSLCWCKIISRSGVFAGFQELGTHILNMLEDLHGFQANL